MRPRSWLSIFAGAALTIVALPATAQNTWAANGKTSLAWWQMSPHFASLWGTTCPEDPSWQAGEGASSQWRTTASHRRGAEAPDTIHVPLYPRHDVQPLCREAVTGRIFLPDTITWRGVHGQVTILMDSLEMGSTMRDRFAYSSVFETTRYPSVRYTIDSVVSLSQQGDTLVGTAAGVLSIRGVERTLPAAIRAWREAGDLRVLAKLRIPASELEAVFNMSKIALGLGVGMHLWQDLFIGADLLWQPETTAGR